MQFKPCDFSLHPAAHHKDELQPQLVLLHCYDGIMNDGMVINRSYYDMLSEKETLSRLQ